MSESWDQVPIADSVYEFMRAKDPAMQLLEEFLADQPPLPPWQREFLDQVLYGSGVTLSMPRRGGRSTLHRYVGEFEHARKGLTPLMEVHDEITDWRTRHMSPAPSLIHLCTEHPLLATRP